MSSLYTSHHGSVIHVFFCIFFMFQWFTPLLYTTHDVSLIHVFYFHNYHDVSVIHVFLHMFTMFQWFMSICICSWCFSDSCKLWNFSDSCLFAYITCCFSDLCHYKITFYDASLFFLFIMFTMFLWIHVIQFFNVIHVKIIKVGSYNNRYLQQFGDIARLRTCVTCTHLYNLVSCYQLSHMTRVTLVVSK